MKLLRCILFVLGVINCSIAKKENSNEIEAIVPTQQITKDKQYRYYIEMSVYLPFELYLNNNLSSINI